MLAEIQDAFRDSFIEFARTPSWFAGTFRKLGFFAVATKSRSIRIEKRSAILINFGGKKQSLSRLGMKE